jgi:hypothetical protein
MGRNFWVGCGCFSWGGGGGEVDSRVRVAEKFSQREIESATDSTE